MIVIRLNKKLLRINYIELELIGAYWTNPISTDAFEDFQTSKL